MIRSLNAQTKKEPSETKKQPSANEERTERNEELSAKKEPSAIEELGASKVRTERKRKKDREQMQRPTHALAPNGRARFVHDIFKICFSLTLSVKAANTPEGSWSFWSIPPPLPQGHLQLNTN